MTEAQPMQDTTTKKGNGSFDKNITIEKVTGTEGAPGRVTLSEDVIATIAGYVARDVEGIHSLGKPRLLSLGDNPSRGVDAEVGKIEAAFDLDVVIDYGSDLRAVTRALRNRIADEVNKTGGRKVVEVNIHVVGLHLPDEAENKEPESPRVR
jgi:uncharacterized alkaline shock family protein YloU